MISKALPTIFLGILITGMSYSPVAAQTTETETAPPETTGSAADLEITPRVGTGYNSSAAGHDGFGRFESFVPLFQNPGKDLLFLEGRFLLDNSANLGGNVLLGYRAFNPELNRTFGGYVGYDNRDTGTRTFNQIGLGLESLGEIWDFRLNGYLPVGDTRQVVASNTVESNLQLTGDPFFQGNSLLLPVNGTFQTTTIREAAMSGLDLEVGAKITEFANGGEVRGQVGIYYYDASGSPSTVGGKIRVEVKPTDYLNLGLGVQHDDLFGTNILFTVGGTFPGTRPAAYRQEPDEMESVWARIGESVSRSASIIVDQQVTSETFTGESTVTATNPATGQPWVFVHVTEGGNSDGTFESPFSTLQEGIAVTQSDGNYIIYVRSGANSVDIGSITIPAQVQLLSAGVLQEISIQGLGLVALPFSNSGQLTNFTGTITLADQSVLSGFNLTSNSGPGIIVRDIGEITIRDSSITSSSQAALLLANTTGTVTLTNTNLTGNGVPALVGTNINNLTVTGGKIISTNSTTNGVTLNGVTGNLTLANGKITDSQAEGILVENSSGAIAISDFQIHRAQHQGILLRQVDGTVQIANNKISDTAGVLPGDPTTANPPTGQGIGLFEVTGAVEITDNQVNGTTGFFGNSDFTNPANNYLSTGQGIALINTTAGEVSLTISGNQVENNGIDTADPTANIRGDGIGIFLEGEAMVNSLDISNNRITNNGGNGVIINQGRLTFGSSGGTDGGNSQISNATITDNTIENNTLNGITIESFGGTGNLVIKNNSSIRDNDFRGISIFANGDGQITTGITSNNINNNGFSGIDISAFEDGQITTETTSNSISQNGFRGISIFANENGKITEKITNNSISQNGAEGINNSASGNGWITAEISNNSINDNAANGIFISASGDTQITKNITNNNISNNGSNGIFIESNENGQITANINNNTNISNNGFNGIHILTFENALINTEITDNLSISDNGINGIFIEANENVQITTKITGNNITNNTSSGIHIFANGNGQITGNIKDNTDISQNDGSGITIEANGNGQITANIKDNTDISNNDVDGITIFALGNGQITLSEITNNSISNNGSLGINISTFLGNGEVTAEISNNSISQNGFHGIGISAGGDGQITTNINNNTNIDDNGQIGIVLTASENGKIMTTITENLSISNNVFDGILILTNGNGEISALLNDNTNISNNGVNGIFIDSQNGQIEADVQNNQLTNNTNFGLNGTTFAGRLCVHLNGNNSDTDYQLTNNGGTLEVESLADVNMRNTGNVAVGGMLAAVNAVNCL
ncbi:MAG: hypothetical protein F6K47_09660 [Symploca sp. SIO2E6]|nr:hypothetical protein [Symploca sp. SIO2E6]